ncbi:MAG: hypothetical protein WBP79_05945 [Candidatus Acidiferrales bacterium]
MTTTFQKRQKEMKRMEKARMKAENRAQKKLADRAARELAAETGVLPNDDIAVAPDPEPEAQP